MVRWLGEVRWLGDSLEDCRAKCPQTSPKEYADCWTQCAVEDCRSKCPKDNHFAYIVCASSCAQAAAIPPPEFPPLPPPPTPKQPPTEQPAAPAEPVQSSILVPTLLLVTGVLALVVVVLS